MAAKVFEVDDVLPATTQLKISWIKTLFNGYDYGIVAIDTQYSIWPYFIHYEYYGDIGSDHLYIDAVDIFNGESFESPYTDYGGEHAYIVLDTSSWSLDRRTITYVSEDDSYFVWEDLNAQSGYTITFNSNGGTTIPDIEEAAELPTPLPTPTKDGYKFVAWYYESNFQTRANAGDTIESNVTLYAKWHNLGTLFTGIANAIRSKDGTSGNIRDLDFDDRIRGLDTCIYLTQEEYDLLDPPNENITYIIVEVE